MADANKGERTQLGVAETVSRPPAEVTPPRSVVPTAGAQDADAQNTGVQNTAIEPAVAPLADDLRVVDDLPRRRVFGLDFVAAEGLEAVVDAILDGPYLSDRLPAVVTPNVDILVHLERNETSVETKVFHDAQFCLPDGQPIVIASRLLASPLPARLPGSGLFEKLWPRVCTEDVPVTVVASSDQIAEGLAAEHPRTQTIVAPMFTVDDTETQAALAAEVIERARQDCPRLVFVGIGNPKDARIIDQILRQWPSDLGPKPLCLALGASFAMYLGHAKRAPEWVQRVGMEWFYRFAQEPRRLFYRYFVRDTAFFGIVWRAWKSK